MRGATMTDTSGGISELEKLLARRRDELAEQRAVDAEQSTDEKLLAAALNEVFNARHRRERQEAAAKAATDPLKQSRMNRWGLVIPLLVLLISGGVAAWGGTPVAKFQLLAASAAVVGAVAAFIRLWAHEGSKALDGLGKAIGLTSAMFAATATIALLMLVK